MKLSIAREPYAPMPGVPPARPADILLQGLDGRVIEDYPSFTLVDVHERDLEMLVQRAHAAVVPHSMQDETIHLNGHRIDPRDPASAHFPGETLDAPYPPGQDGMWLIQFLGPIKEEWIAAVEAEGVVMVQYISYHAYLVGASEEQIRRVAALRFIQWTAQMHRFLKPTIPPRPGTMSEVRVFLAATDQTPDAVSFLGRLSRTAVVTHPFSVTELNLWGTYRADDFESVVAHPLVFAAIKVGEESLIPNVPAASDVALMVIAAAIAAVALLRLHS